MNIKELMIGDLLRVNRDGLCIKKDTIVQVRGIHGDNRFEEKGLVGCANCRPLDKMQFDGGIWLDYLDPIPLTPEILEKNGFSRNGLDIALFDRRGGDDFIGASNLQYVHELQHAILLCGIDNGIIV